MWTHYGVRLIVLDAVGHQLIVWYTLLTSCTGTRVEIQLHRTPRPSGHNARDCTFLDHEPLLLPPASSLSEGSVPSSVLEVQLTVPWLQS